MEKRERPLFESIIAGLAVIGIADTIVITLRYFDLDLLACGTEGCNIVLASPYALILGIPLSVLGLFYYTLVLVLSFFLKHVLYRTLLLLLTGAGFFFSLYLFYLQFSVIGAFCTFCLVSAVLSTLLFGTTLFGVTQIYEQTQRKEDSSTSLGTKA